MVRKKFFLSPLKSPWAKIFLLWALCTLLTISRGSAVSTVGAGANNLAPNQQYWLGTTHLGNDSLLYLASGMRDAISFSVLSLFLSLFLGLLMGTLIAYRGGWLDLTLSRIMDTVGALPFFYVMLVLARFWSLDWITLAVSFSLLGGWLPFAWHTREQTLAVKNQDFIWALRAMGASFPYLLVKVLCPYNLSLLRPLIALRFNYLILSLTTLDFLGISPRPFDTASLGQLMSWGAHRLESWWLWLPSVLLVTWMTWELTEYGKKSKT